MCVMGDLNGWLAGRLRVGKTGAFGILGENNKERGIFDSCAERGLCVGNTYFKHKSLQKYTKVARTQDRVEEMNMTDLVLVKKDMLHYLQDVKRVRGMKLSF